MATRADEFKSTEERSRETRAREAAQPKRATPRKRLLKRKHVAGADGTTSITRKATVALETNADGNAQTKPNRGQKPAAKPSRKSTRSGANRTKAASQLSRRQTRKTTSPKARA